MQYAKTKLNRSGSSHSGFLMRPLDLSVFGTERLSAGQRVVFSALLGFSKNSTCDFTFREICERYRLSPATVCRAIQKALKSGFKRGEKKNLYLFDGERDEEMLYVLIEEWLYFATFEIEGISRYLTDIDCEILSLLRDYHRRNWHTSQNWIAEQLGISPSTASASINRLKAMKLISVQFTRRGINRAVNHHTRALYVVNESLLSKKKSELIKRAKGVSAQVKAADENTVRERFYSGLQQAERDRLDALLNDLGEEYIELDRQLGVLEMELGKADARENGARLKELLQRRLEVKAAMRKMLEERGMTESDLEERHFCGKCSDKGTLPNGTFCNCWMERRR